MSDNTGPAAALEQILQMWAIKQDAIDVQDYLWKLSPVPRVNAARWFHAAGWDRLVHARTITTVIDTIPQLAGLDPHLMASSAIWVQDITGFEKVNASQVTSWVRQGVDALTKQSRPEAVDHALWLLDHNYHDDDLGRLNRALRAWGTVDPQAAFMRAQRIEQCQDHRERVRRTAARAGLNLLPQVAEQGRYLVRESLEWLLGIVPRYMILETNPLATHLAHATDGLAHLGVPYMARTLCRIMGIAEPYSEGWNLARGKLKGLLGVTPSVTTHFTLLSQPVPSGVRDTVAAVLQERIGGPDTMEILDGLIKQQDPELAAQVLPKDSAARRALFTRFAPSA